MAGELLALERACDAVWKLALACTQLITAGHLREQGKPAVIVLALVGLLLTLAVSCTAHETPPAPALIVAVAANAKPALEEIGARFQEQRGVEVTFVVGSTGTLTQQIENGAPFDVFVAADVAHIDQLAAQGLILAGSQRVYGQGRIVLALNKASGVLAATLADLTDPAIARVAIANPTHAPYGQAAQEALMTAGVWARVQSKLVWAENVRQALQFVQTGDAVAGIVALSIANAPEVSFTLLPADLHRPLEQAIAVSGRSRQPQTARQFVEYVTGSDGRQVLRQYGYLAPGDF